MRENKAYEEFLAKVISNIVRLRKERQITQEEMDDGVFSIPVSTYAKIEQNSNKDIKLSSIFHIAQRLNIPVYELLKTDEPSN